ncbi:hypothetical protein SAMN02745205_01659 [Porphyromonas cangingivalis]|uniref:Uncharacterized protein n=1 Tax=Porphyromonas cangingivalis TaxID=36874 RepID=A0A1T4MSL0_PORCN|nr:hypothetical protein SAMN02745205_01659 [Porphyromonas cangingivalis]
MHKVTHYYSFGNKWTDTQRQADLTLSQTS